MNSPRSDHQGREYQRVSYDGSGRQKSNTEQHDDNVKAGPGFGITSWGEPYSDVGSASRAAKKGNRDDFPRLVEDIRTGHFDADILVLWESSRGSRQVSEWCQLIEACEDAGVRIAVTTHARIYDPANPRDRKSMLEDAVDSEYEAEKTRLRIKRDTTQGAVAGRPHGRVPFGYRRVFDPTSGRFVAQVPDDAEAAIVVECYERAAAGESLIGLARDLTARGVVSRTRVVKGVEVPGKPFHPQTLRWMLLAPLYRGKRVHSPGTTAQRLANPAHLYDGAWPPLVDDALWFTVSTRLRDPKRKTSRPGSGKHLLSMIATCDACGSPLSATYRHKGKRRYQCHRGAHLLIDADRLDAWAEDYVLAVLTDPANLARLQPDSTDEAALAIARDVVARVRAEHGDLIAQVRDGKVSATLAAGSEPGILARLAAAEAEVADLTVPAELRQLIDLDAVVVEEWKAKAMEVKREMMRLLFAPGRLGQLSIARAEKGKWSQPWSRVRLDGRRLSASDALDAASVAAGDDTPDVAGAA